MDNLPHEDTSEVADTAVVTASHNGTVQSREESSETFVEQEGGLAKQTTKTTITETSEGPDRIVTKIERRTVITKKQVLHDTPCDEQEYNSLPYTTISEISTQYTSNGTRPDHTTPLEVTPEADFTHQRVQRLEREPSPIVEDDFGYVKPSSVTVNSEPGSPVRITVEGASDDSQAQEEPQVDLSPEEFDALVSATSPEDDRDTSPEVEEPSKPCRVVAFVDKEDEEEVKEDEEEVKEDISIPVVEEDDDSKPFVEDPSDEEKVERLQPVIESIEEESADLKSAAPKIEEVIDDKNTEPKEDKITESENTKDDKAEEADVQSEPSKAVEEAVEAEIVEQTHRERAIDVEKPKEDTVVTTPTEVSEPIVSDTESSPGKSAKPKKKGFFAFFKRKSKRKDDDEEEATPLFVVTPPGETPPPSSPATDKKTPEETPEKKSPVVADTKPEAPEETATREDKEAKPEVVEQAAPPIEDEAEDVVPELGGTTAEQRRLTAQPDQISIAESEPEAAMTPPTTLTAAQPTPFTRAGLLAQSNPMVVAPPPTLPKPVGVVPQHVDNHFVIVAIDFGTTFSGYAFAFTRQPDSVHMMRKWEGGDPGVVNQKTPTCLLLTPEGEFKAFGFTARDMYHDLDPVEASRWLYFEKFKMMLHYEADLNKNTMVTAANGVQLPALTVFSHSLQFFKNHALQELSDQSSTAILNEDVRWVLTVPAIWKAPAKQFMRQAAYNAGIATPEYPDQLLIALEPEAGSIYVRRLRLYQLVPEKPQRRPLSITRDATPPATNLHNPNMNKISDELITGTRYMLVDCGGGTVDITVHEMEDHGHLKELYKASGGPYGSVGIELEFERLLVAIFGGEFIDSFRSKRPAGWVDLMIAFESRKRAATPYKNNALNVSLPFSFIDYYKKKKGSGVDSAIRKHGDKDVRWSSQGMLRLMPSAMLRLFTPTMERIQQAIGDVLNNPAVKGIEYLFLVGGFAESQILQLHLRTEFSHLLKIIIPQDVSLTILKGAVCYGLDPTVVTVRWSRMTYGVGVLNRFVAGKHPQEKLVQKDGVDWCTDVFDKFVCVNEPVGLGDTVLRSYTPAKAGQKASIINVYAADSPDASFISDPGVRHVGSLCLDLSETAYEDRSERREIQTRMTFGDTEIKVSTLDVATDKVVRCTIDFLNK